MQKEQKHLHYDRDNSLTPTNRWLPANLETDSNTTSEAVNQKVSKAQVTQPHSAAVHVRQHTIPTILVNTFLRVRATTGFKLNKNIAIRFC